LIQHKYETTGIGTGIQRVGKNKSNVVAAFRWRQQKHRSPSVRTDKNGRNVAITLLAVAKGGD
jgi:hypothetical protein